MLTIPARFNGPPGSGNGGWVSGAVAALLPGDPFAVTVVLRRPPPLDVPLDVRAGDDGGVEVLDGDQLVARVAATADVDGEPPAPVGWDDAEAAAARYPGLVDHPFPTCFSCGTDRGDGLGLRPGAVPGRPGTVAASWVPHASTTDDGSVVTRQVTWAALDCPGGWSVDIVGRPMVLGTMTARLDALPRAGRRHVVVGRADGEQGRRTFTSTALYDVEGAEPVLLGRAAAVWVRVDPATLTPSAG
ncbi:hypothetical protein [Angustibacter aerolatus]